MTDPTVNPAREAQQHLTAAYLTARWHRADGGKSDAPLRVAAAQAEATLAVAEQLRATLAEQERHHKSVVAGLLHLGKRLDRIADALDKPAPAAGRPVLPLIDPPYPERAAAEPADVPEQPLRALLDRWAADIDRHMHTAAAEADEPRSAYYYGYAAALRQAHGDLRLALDAEVPDAEAVDDPADLDALKAALARAEAAKREPAVAEQPAAPVDLADRQRGVVRAAIDQCAERYEVRGDILNVFDRQRRGDVATDIALAVSSAGLGQPDWHYLDDVIRRHMAGGGFNVEGWPMDTPEARAALTRVLCDAPPEPPAAALDAEAADLASRRGAVIRAAIDHAADVFPDRGVTLDVCVPVHRSALAHRVAVAVSGAVLGRPDPTHLDGVIRAEAERQGLDRWRMDSPFARACLTRVLCDAPPEPWQHPVMRRDAEAEPEQPAGVPAPRAAVDDADQ